MITKHDLINLLSKHICGGITHLTLKMIENPKWNKAEKVHDWRNHVIDSIRNNWKELSFETRLVVYVIAEGEADREEWE